MVTQDNIGFKKANNLNYIKQYKLNIVNLKTFLIGVLFCFFIDYIL